MGELRSLRVLQSKVWLTHNRNACFSNRLHLKAWKDTSNTTSPPFLEAQRGALTPARTHSAVALFCQAPEVHLALLMRPGHIPQALVLFCQDPEVHLALLVMPGHSSWVSSSSLFPCSSYRPALTSSRELCLRYATGSVGPPSVCCLALLSQKRATGPPGKSSVTAAVVNIAVPNRIFSCLGFASTGHIGKPRLPFQSPYVSLSIASCSSF